METYYHFKSLVSDRIMNELASYMNLSDANRDSILVKAILENSKPKIELPLTKSKLDKAGITLCLSGGSGTDRRVCVTQKGERISPIIRTWIEYDYDERGNFKGILKQEIIN